MCIDEVDLHSVEHRVSSIARGAFGSDELVPGTELHAAEIYHRKKHFKDWTDFDTRVALLEQFVDVLNMPEVLLIDIQVNCDLLYGNQSPADIAFMFLVEKADDLMKAHESLGMLIGDRENDRVAARHATTLSGYRAVGTGFEFGRDITMLVDSAHFTHSHLSRFCN